MTAFCGPSGIGKSTLLKVFMGLMEPDRGKFLVDGQELQMIGIKSYRAAVGTVTQEDTLFTGSIRENISFFDLSPNDERIREVAKLAEIHDVIVKMPMGYESLIGDMGTALSMGQQQRLLIARALYSQPRALFLDEGTAHLDAQTEFAIMTKIRDMGLTCIFVTHNVELVKLADQVVYWDAQSDIRVIQQDELLAVGTNL
jgi:ATP-binding cassette subfamily B protein RaxB